MGQFNADEFDHVILSLDDGVELECAVYAIFDAGDRDYVALIPLDGSFDTDGDIYLYRYEASGENDEDIQLGNIESDEEYEIVSDAFDELLDNEEFDELFGDDPE